MFRSKSYLLLISALFCCVLQAGSYEAMVTAVRGTAFELDARQQVVRTLSTSVGIPEGHAIQTRPGATVTVVLANGGVITVQPNTTLVLEQMQLDGDASLASYRPLRPSAANTRTRLRLDRGEVLGEVKGIRANSKFEVASAVGTAGISGTKFVVSVTISGNTYVMKVTNIDGTVVTTVTGEAPTSVPAGTSTELSGSFDSDTGAVSEAVSSDPASVPASALDAFTDIIDNAVDNASTTDQVDMPTDLIPLGEEGSVDGVISSDITEIGTNL